LREELVVVELKFERPRVALVEVLGDANQGCPCLILDDPTKAEGLAVKEANGYFFMDDHKAIIEYLARHYGTSRPSHD